MVVKSFYKTGESQEAGNGTGSTDKQRFTPDTEKAGRKEWEAKNERRQTHSLPKAKNITLSETQI